MLDSNPELLADGRCLPIKLHHPRPKLFFKRFLKYRWWAGRKHVYSICSIKSFMYVFSFINWSIKIYFTDFVMLVESLGWVWEKMWRYAGQTFFSQLNLGESRNFFTEYLFSFSNANKYRKSKVYIYTVLFFWNFFFFVCPQICPL